MDKINSANKHAKILIIDDEAYVRESIKGFLEDYSYDVIEAENGIKGLESFALERPDIVLCDLRMPEIDGLEVLDKVVKKSPNTPIIIVSGVGNISDTVEALRIGAWDYIIKPVQDMTVILHSIQKSLERASLIREKENYRKELEELNFELKKSLDTLERTKNKLVQSEKMAALGGLVAGVAHEINTPVGIVITASSFLKDKTADIQELYKNGNLKKSDLESYLQNMEEVSQSIFINMERAATLIKSFKQVAVDQTFEERRRFNLKHYVEDILISLKPTYRNKGCVINLECADNINIISYPGAYSQIINNLVMNSIIHGFKEKKDGHISIVISLSDIKEDSKTADIDKLGQEDQISRRDQETNHELTIYYSDNGTGMTEEQVIKVFDPFYTTMRGQGGSGLGMSIVFNLITQTLKGSIECRSIPNIKTEFIINIPFIRMA